MRKTTLFISVAILLSISISYSGAPGDAAAYFQEKMALVKGKGPLPFPGSDLPPPKCGTPVTAALYAVGSRIEESPLNVQEARPDYLPLSFGRENVLVHYAVSGEHACYEAAIDTLPADGIPDFINKIADIFEYVIDMETGPVNLGKMGFDPPPSDNSGGGDNRYDIYVINLNPGYYGFAVPEGVAGQYQTSSFIELENDFSGTYYQNNPIAAVKVTAAHEYFHAVQFGYDALEFDYDDISNSATYKPWWLEASAVWAEEIVYDSLDDYINYLPYFYNYPWMNLGTFSYEYGDPRAYHAYAASVWPIFLSEKYGIEIIRQIWEGCASVPGYNTLTALNNVLVQRSTNLSKSFLEFSVWNYHTGSRADANLFFSEGALFPEVSQTGFIGQPGPGPDSIGGFSNPPEHTGANYIVVQPSQEPGGLSIDFNGDDITSAEWHTAVLGISSQGSEWLDIAVNPHTGAGAIDWYNWNSYDNIIIIPTVSGVSPYYISYNYGGSVAHDTLLSGDSVVYVFPGDLDNNGIVEEEDILPLAAYWSEAGDVRDGTGYLWSPSAANLWGSPFATYADADGNGNVDIRDFPAILLNWGSLHIGTNLSPPGANLNMIPDENVLYDIYNQVRGSKNGPRYLIKIYLEDILGITTPDRFILGQNYPNPFNGRTSIEYGIEAPSEVRLAVYNLLGQEVIVLIDEKRPAGRYIAEWDGRDGYGRQVASGLYFYRLETSDEVDIKKMILLK